MKITSASYEITRFEPEVDIREITRGYCLCYETPMPESFEDKCAFVKKHRNHESPLEHSIMSVLFHVNRGVSHEEVRHRHIAVSQQSTRYCNYSNGRFDNQITVINNTAFINDSKAYEIWLKGREADEAEYMELLKMGYKPEEIRDCLPIALATKILISTNYREWRSIFALRTDLTAHYQMREVMRPLFNEVCDVIPCIFDDIREIANK